MPGWLGLRGAGGAEARRTASCGRFDRAPNLYPTPLPHSHPGAAFVPLLLGVTTDLRDAMAVPTPKSPAKTTLIRNCSQFGLTFLLSCRMIA